jgi:hypothetical protein
MTNGVDEKRRIQYGECASDAGEEKTTDSTHHAIEEKAREKRAGQARKEQKGVVFMLPDGHGIVCNTRRILWVGVSIGDKEPSTVAVPEAVLCIVRIFLLVTMRVMSQMISSPFDGGVL